MHSALLVTFLGLIVMGVAFSSPYSDKLEDAFPDRSHLAPWSKWEGDSERLSADTQARYRSHPAPWSKWEGDGERFRADTQARHRSHPAPWSKWEGDGEGFRTDVQGRYRSHPAPWSKWEGDFWADTRARHPNNRIYETAQSTDDDEKDSNFRHIYSLDMAIPGENCPSNLKLYTHESLRLCGKETNGAGCDSVNISTDGQEYQEVRGKVKAYQFGSPDAFGANIDDIDRYYVDGVSITHGESPRQHVWTYAIGVWKDYHAGSSGNKNTCPGTGYGNPPPDFVGTNYICSSANLTPSWDRQLYYPALWSNIFGDCANDCGKNPVFFCVKLPDSTTDDLELRVCTNQNQNDEDIRIESVDIYIR